MRNSRTTCADSSTFYWPEPELPVEADGRLEDRVRLQIHTRRTHVAGTVQQSPAEQPPDSPAPGSLVDGHLGEFVGTAPHGYESDRSDGLTFVQRHEDRAAGVEDLLPRVVEVEPVGVLDLPVKSDPVEVHLAERFSMLSPEVDDLDFRVLALRVVLCHVTAMETIPSVATSVITYRSTTTLYGRRLSKYMEIGSV